MFRGMKQAIAQSRLITESLLEEYLDLAGAIRELEKKKDEMRKSIMYAYPEGGALGAFLIFIESMDRRSFPLDDVKAQVSAYTWDTLYKPYIKITEVQKLVIKKQQY